MTTMTVAPEPVAHPLLTGLSTATRFLGNLLVALVMVVLLGRTH